MYSIDEFRSHIPSYEHDILHRSWITIRPAVDTYQQTNQTKYGGFPAPLTQTKHAIIPDHVRLADLSEEEIEFCGNLLFPGLVKQGCRMENTGMPAKWKVTVEQHFYFPECTIL